MKTLPIKLLSLFSLLLVIYSCEKDDSIIEQENFLKTVALEEAEAFLSESRKKNSSDFVNSFITSISEEINYEDITNTDEELAVIPVTTIYKHLQSRIALLEIDGEVQSVVVGMHPFENSTKKSFSGEMLITDMNGNFLKAFKIEKNVFVKEYIKNNIDSKFYANNYGAMLKSTDDCYTCPFSDCSLCGELDEVVIRTPTPYVSITQMYPTGGGDGQSDCEVGCDNNWNPTAGGGNYNTDVNENCPDGFTRDEYDECVPVDTPCDELLEQFNNSKYSDRLNELLENVGSSTESGFAQNKDGSFTTLSATNSGHSLNGMGPNSIGYTHMHTNGTLFSPKDINTFITMLTSAHFGDPQIPLDQIYGTVISDGEVYILRYDGTWEDLDRIFNVSNKSYARYMNKFSNYLDGFMNLLQTRNSSNFRILNLNTDNNTFEELTLDSSNTTTRSNPCN